MKSIEQVINELKSEKAGVVDKLGRLNGALGNPHGKEISSSQFDLMIDQANVMSSYSEILSDRIQDLEEQKD